MTKPDPFYDELRRALEARAATVETAPDALGAIRTRIARRHAWWPRTLGGRMFALSTGAATAVAATFTFVVFSAGGCAPPATDQPPRASGSASSSSGSPDASASAGPSDGGSASAAAAPVTANVPVYFTGNVRGVPMLYREYHVLTVGDGSRAGKVRAAVTEMLDGRNAKDPDYISSWP